MKEEPGAILRLPLLPCSLIPRGVSPGILRGWRTLAHRILTSTPVEVCVGGKFLLSQKLLGVGPSYVLFLVSFVAWTAAFEDRPIACN